MKGTILQAQCKKLLEYEMKNIFKDANLEDRLIPKFAVGCKRVIPSGFRYLRVS